MKKSTAAVVLLPACAALGAVAWVKGGRVVKSFKILDAIDIRTVNTVVDDAGSAED
ncbi:hypothetical protein [Cryptosporangium sp. NPDC051539]|uniref:hypothetical protein n=1 Tax=Cryptosporangium sp. NPDC051539 TaxID=3363962 RepID=UPI0037914C8A